MYSRLVCKALILTLLIRISLVTDMGYVKPYKIREATQSPPIVTGGKASYLRIARAVTSDSKGGTTTQPNNEESDNETTGIESSSRDEIESSNIPYSMDSEKAKPHNTNRDAFHLESIDRKMTSLINLVPNSTSNGKPGLDKLLEFISKNKYNAYEIPKTDWSHSRYPRQVLDPVWVSIHFNIHSVSDIDETDESVSLEVDITTEWLDGKLREWFENEDRTLAEEYHHTWPEGMKFIPLDSKLLEKFWSPDISIGGLAKVTKSKILSQSERLRFRLYGDFIYEKRVTMKVKCDMDFTYYPADTQKCDLVLKSYSYNSEDLWLLWREPEGVYLMQTSDPNFDLQVVDVTRYSISARGKKKCERNDCHLSDPDEKFDVLRFTLQIRRKIYYQLLQTYIPSALYIGITWLCFMIPRRMVEGRMAISMTTLLTLTSTFEAVRESTPIVSYIKAIDVWMVVGIFFIFLNLLEFTILLWIEAANRDEKERAESGQEEAKE